MTDDLDFILRYTSDAATILRRIDPQPIIAAIDALHEAWRTHRAVMFCGNGGSGASCSHIVNDFQKGLRTECDVPFRAICLNDAGSLVSAWANDSSWQDVFSQQVATWGEDGAVLVAVSGSGNSENVLRAVDAANRRAVTTIGISGFDGGSLAKQVDISIHVLTSGEDAMQRAEDAHMVILHMLYLGLVRRIKQAQGVPLAPLGASA